MDPGGFLLICLYCLPLPLILFLICYTLLKTHVNFSVNCTIPHKQNSFDSKQNFYINIHLLYIFPSFFSFSIFVICFSYPFFLLPFYIISYTCFLHSLSNQYGCHRFVWLATQKSPDPFPLTVHSIQPDIFSILLITPEVGLSALSKCFHAYPHMVYSNYFLPMYFMYNAASQASIILNASASMVDLATLRANFDF